MSQDLGLAGEEYLAQTLDVERAILDLETFDFSIPADLALPLMRLICLGDAPAGSRDHLIDLVASWIDCLEDLESIDRQHADIIRRLFLLTGEPVVSPIPKPKLFPEAAP